MTKTSASTDIDPSNRCRDPQPLGREHSITGEVWDLPARSPHRIITAVLASSTPHRVLPGWWTVSLRFVTIGPVTVVGKGGRPRKCRSDTDLVRAYRARQRGGEEPPTVDEALDAGDDAAFAWNRVRELETAVEALRRETKLSKASVREAHKALDQERVRFGWINEENIRLRSEVEALRTGATPAGGTSPGRST